MNYPEYSYCELVLGGVKNRGDVLSGKVFNERLGNNGRAGCYRSHFRFTVDYQNHVMNTGSVKGYKGSAYVDALWIDIDDTNDLSKALDTAKIFIHRMQLEYEIPPDHLRCYFSGKKGFHIGIPAEVFGLTASETIPGICKALSQQLAGDLACYDPSVYDRTRLFRLNNTKHEGSGYYKIELEPQEILHCKDVQTIVDLAATPRELEREYNPEDSYGTLAHLVTVDIELPERPEQIGQSQDKWVTEFLEKGVTEGGRTHAVTRLAGYYKKKGIPEDIALALIISWDIAKNTPSLTGDDNYPADKIRITVSDVYKYPDDETGNGLVSSSDIVFHNWETLHAQAPAYVEKFSKNRLRFGFPLIDAKSALLGRGEVAALLGYAGQGKSVLGQNIQLTVMENQKIKSVLFSLEMTAMMLYFRQVGMLWGLSSSEVAKEFALGNGADLKKGMENYTGMYIVDHVPLAIPLIAESLKDFDEDIGLVIIDYVGLMDSTSDLEYERMNNLGRGLVLMAKELNVAILAIYQTNRTGARGEIYLDSGRGSGMIEANCDICLGIWTDDEESYPTERTVKLLKARHGIKGAKQTLTFMGNGPRLYVADREDGNEY